MAVGGSARVPHKPRINWGQRACVSGCGEEDWWGCRGHHYTNQHTVRVCGELISCCWFDAHAIVTNMTDRSARACVHTHGSSCGSPVYIPTLTS